MSRNMEAALVLVARDEASRPLARVLQEITRAAGDTGKAVGNAGQTGSRAMQQLGIESKATERAVTGITKEANNAGKTVNTAAQAGSKSMYRLATDTKNAERAVIGLSRESQRMASSGKLSASEQARAYQAMTAKVSALRREMQGVVEQQSRLQRMGGMANGAIGIGGGMVASGMMLQQPMMDERQYDLSIRHAVNVALADQTLPDRISGVNDMKQLVKRGYEQGGGTRDGALAAVNTLLGSGALGDDSKQAMKSADAMLPVIMRYSTAGNAEPTDIANLSSKMKQTWQISDKELPRYLEMQLQAGKLGGMESKDMSRHLPAQLGLAKTAGFYGKEGFADLLAMNQAAMLTAGSPDQAANNILNMLGKLGAKETADDMKKLGFKDWGGHLAAERGKGKNAAQVYLEALDSVVGKDKAYQSNQKKLASTKAGSPEEKALLEAQQRILKSKTVGQVSSDMQELLAVLAVMDNQDKVRKMRTSILEADPNSKTGSNVDHKLIMDSSFMKSQQGDNAIQAASNDFFSKANEWWGDAKKGFADWASDNPKAAAGTVGGGVVGGAVAGGLGAQALWQRLMGMGGEQAAKTTASTTAQRAASAGSPAIAAAAAPLVVMAGVTAWAGKQDHRTELGWLTSLSNWMNEFLGKQAEIDARREANLAELVDKPIPLQLQLKGDFRIQGNDLVATVNQQNSFTARRN